VSDAALLVDDTVTIAVQVNGKRRDEVTLKKGLPASEVESIVLKLDNVRRALDGKAVRKIIVVPDRIANVVVG
jgi:leucyl-tRNA synthetase